MNRISILFTALALVACGGPEDPHHSDSESCNRISEACHAVDTGSGRASECHEIAHDEGTDEACEPIETECIAVCEAAAADGGAGDGGHDHHDHDAGTADASAPDAGAPDASSEDGGTAPEFQAIAPCEEPSDYVDGTHVAATGSNDYDPPCIRVRAGVELTIEASTDHPLRARTGGSAGSPIPATVATTDTALTFDEPGFYPFLCVDHERLGMIGVVQVVP